MLTTRYVPPQRNSFTEERVRAELQRIDPLLDIRWAPVWAYNEHEQSYEGRYVLVCYWPQDDKRRSQPDLAPGGETWDVLGTFTEDPADASSVPASPDAVLRLVVEHLGRCDATRLPHAARMAQIHERNMRRTEELKSTMVDEAVEEALKARTGLYKPPTVNVIDNTARN